MVAVSLAYLISFSDFPQNISSPCWSQNDQPDISLFSPDIPAGYLGHLEPQTGGLINQVRPPKSRHHIVLFLALAWALFE